MVAELHCSKSHVMNCCVQISCLIIGLNHWYNRDNAFSVAAICVYEMAFVTAMTAVVVILVVVVVLA